MSPLSSSALSRSCPARPMNGRPVASSLSPGPSPTNTRGDEGFPSPKTTLRRFSESAQPVHVLASCAIRRSSSIYRLSLIVFRLSSDRFQFTPRKHILHVARVQCRRRFEEHDGAFSLGYRTMLD